MAFKFESLKIWQLAMELSNDIDVLTAGFPRREIFSLSSQIKRAADSVALNIAEGSTGQTKAEFRRFLTISLRSAIEVVSCLFLAVRRNYIDEARFKQLYASYEILCRMITRLRSSI